MLLDIFVCHMTLPVFKESTFFWGGDVDLCLCFDSPCTHAVLSVWSCHTAAIWAQIALPASQRGDFVFALSLETHFLSSIPLTRCYDCSWLRLEPLRVFLSY